MKLKKVIIPAGTYYIGDPSQILPEYILNKISSSESNQDNIVQKYDNYNFVIINLDGDGLQYDSDGYKYPIDTSSIAIIPYEIVMNEKFSVDMNITRLKRFNNPVQVRFLPYEFMSVGNIFFELGEGEDIDYEYESNEFGHTYWNEWDDDSE